MEIKFAAVQGRSHRSAAVREVGCERQRKRCEVVWGAPLQEGHRSSRALPTLTRKELRDEQNPERSWERAERYGRGRDDSSSAMGGAGDCRTLLLDLAAIVERTVLEWRETMVSLYSVGGSVPFVR